MCGIVGMIGLNGRHANRGILEAMSAAIRHRGPDDSGSYVDGSVGLASRRLSILDLSSTGHQPMLSPDGQTVLAFNGEIYNYIELRDELQASGHNFRSTGDSEVLLHAYLEWGRECLDKLNGMWAFLIYDARQRKLFGSRDRFGKKPLYYYRSRDEVFFGSEIKALLASGAHQGQPNWDKIACLLLGEGLDQQDEDGLTFYAGIQQLPAGHAFELSLDGSFKQWRFWSLQHEVTDCEGSAPDPVRQFSELFENACSIRTRSDVPIGVLLSGGIDSTSILCSLANKPGVKSLSAFSYQAPERDESGYLRDVFNQTGVRVIPCKVDPSRLWDSLQETLWYQDEPVHSMAAVVHHELYRTASLHGVKVVLNGGGADEYLAGYPSYFRDYWCTLLKAGHVSEAWKEIADHCALRGGSSWVVFRNSLGHLLRSELRRVRAYRKLAARRQRSEFGDNPWFTRELADCWKNNSGREYLAPSLDNALKRSVAVAPLPLYLRIDDRASMAHSVEARVPFLDYRLVSLAFQLPDRWKMRGPWNKFVLREAMRGRIPESVRSRVEKWGFPVPGKDWFASCLSQQVEDLLESQQVRERGIYKLDQIRKDYDLHKKGLSDISGRLFDIVQFELWSRLENAQRTATQPKLSLRHASGA